MARAIVLLIVFIGSILVSKAQAVPALADSNHDVYVLAHLIRADLRKTRGRPLNLDELVKSDSLKRISNSFERIEMKSKGGHISVSYKFSAWRDDRQVELTAWEKETIKKKKWVQKELEEAYDGEIWFEYGERLYLIKKIIVNKHQAGKNIKP